MTVLVTGHLATLFRMRSTGALQNESLGVLVVIFNVILDSAYARAHRERTYEIRLTRMFTLLRLAADPTSLRVRPASAQSA